MLFEVLRLRQVELRAIQGACLEVQATLKVARKIRVELTDSQIQKVCEA